MASRFDEAVRALARTQFGAFSREQALGLGASTNMIKHRLAHRAWETLHPTVYCLAGSDPSWRRDQMAACLWSNGAAGVRAAAHLHGLPSFDAGPIEVVTTKNLRPMARCGIVVHHTKRLPADQIVAVQQIPTTSIDRTLLDLCGHVPERRAAIALDQCLHQGRTTLGALDHCLFLTARRGRDGCGVLRRLIQRRAGISAFPNSPLETVIFDMLVKAGLPAPVLQMNIYDESDRFVARPDFVWPEAKLIVEGHSKLWHLGPAAEESDRQRHDRLVRLRYRVLYVTWADASTYRQGTIARISTELEQSAQAA